MKIKEAALATGLTERAIRLYEEHGLISPSVTVKNGRDFRDYTEENITRLKTIAALRRALFTIDEIKKMLAEPSAIPALVSAHRERMHIDFGNLAYLVEHIDKVDEASVSSVEELASAIFSPSVVSIESSEPTEEEKILFSEQYERIYEKYFSENTGWERKYSASLAVGAFFERLKLNTKVLQRLICGAVLLVFAFFFVCYGIADVTSASYKLKGTSYCVGDKSNDAPAEIKIEGKHKKYIFRDESFEGLIYLDEYMSVQGNASYRSSFYVSEKGCYLNSSDRKDAVLIDSDFAYNSAGELCSVKVIGSFDADFNLTCAAVIIYPQILNSPGSFGGINSARVIVVSVSSDDASDAQELLSTYASSH